MLATILSRNVSFHLLSKNLKIRIYKLIILPVVLYGCETWSLIKGGTKTEGVSVQGAEENIWTKRRMK
jgi:hypothetical protein